MTTRNALIFGLVLLFGTTILAQDYPKVGVPVGYSYMRFNPENSNIANLAFPSTEEAALSPCSLTTRLASRRNSTGTVASQFVFQE
jgi:hypothetical protein